MKFKIYMRVICLFAAAFVELLPANPLTLLAAEPPRYAEHQDLSYVLDANDAQQPIQSATDWAKRRAHILLGIEQAMGPLPRPQQPVPLDLQILEDSEIDGLIRRKLSYCTSSANRRVHAWLLMPKEAKRSPAALCLHQTQPAGKDSPVGLADRPTMHYALELARRGYVTLSPDYPSLGESQYDFDADDFDSGSMVAIYDNVRAIDLLQSLPEVDADRIACIGHSLGGHNGLFTATFDERIKAVVTCCGFTSFARYMNGDLTGWSGPRYMPRIATEYGKDLQRMPFDFHEVIAAIAPRRVHIVAPVRDDNFDVTGVRDVVKAATPIFELLGAKDALTAVYPDCAHDFPDEERVRAYAAIDHALQLHAD